jgi:hypothetical protein
MADLLVPTPVFSRSVVASGAIPAYRFVNFDGTIGTADARAMGVIRDAISDGKMGDVTMIGVAPVETSENLAIGVGVAVDAAGKAKLADTGEIVMGRALVASNSGDKVHIWVECEGVSA